MKKLLKNTTCIAIISLLLLHTNYLAFYYTLYTINVDKLSEDYCEQKSPCCQAKCYLSKKMSEENNNGEQNQQTTEIKLKLSEFQVTELASSLCSTNSQTQYSYFNIIYKNDFSNRIDHPPRF